MKLSRDAPTHHTQQDSPQAYYETQDHDNLTMTAEQYTCDRAKETGCWMLCCACTTQTQKPSCHHAPQALMESYSGLQYGVVTMHPALTSSNAQPAAKLDSCAVPSSSIPLITLSGLGLVTVKLIARRYNVLPTRISCCGCALPCIKAWTLKMQI